MVYIRILGPWPMKCHTSIAFFGWNHGKTHEPWFKGICSYCKPNSDERINTWFFDGPSFLFWSSQFHGFCSQNLNIVRMKLKAFFEEILQYYHHKRYIKVVKCIIIGIKKKTPWIWVSIMEGIPHISWEFWFPLLILSNLFHVNTHRLSLFSSWPKGLHNIIHNNSCKILSLFNSRSFAWA